MLVQIFFMQIQKNIAKCFMNSNKQRFEIVQFWMHDKLILNVGFWQVYVNLFIVTVRYNFMSWFLVTF